jgi:membrane associated rhomboid family serine protease
MEINERDFVREWDQIEREMYGRGPALQINIGKYTILLIAINIIFFGLTTLFPGLIELFAMNKLMALEPWRWITSMFVHFGIVHLMFNMLSLFIFGNIIEKKFGAKMFLLTYLGSGLAGNIGFLLFALPQTFGAGASGAIFGIIGAATIMFPNLVIFLSFIPLPLKIAGPLMAIGEFVLMFGLPDGIGHSAHFFGFVIGIMLAFYLKKQQT